MIVTDSLNVIFREMALDLCYRLQLYNELFCQSTAVVMSAVAIEDYAARAEAVQAVRDCSQALQLIYADLNQILDGRRIVFPPDIADWIWDQPNPDTIISQYLERLQSIAQSMEMSLNTEVSKMEVEQ